MPRIKGASIGEHHELVWAGLAGALRELLTERDYDSITMGHIAERAGLARNTLYNYGRDKGALVTALTERVGRPTVARVAAIAAPASAGFPAATPAVDAGAAGSGAAGTGVAGSSAGVAAAGSAADRLAEIVGVVLEAFTDQVLQLMFRPGAALPEPGEPKGPDSPFHAIVVAVEQVVRDGIARKEFRDPGDVTLVVELLSGVMRAGAERVGRTPADLPATVAAAREIVLASVARRP